MRSLFSALLFVGATPLSLLAQVGDGADIDRSKPPAHWPIPAAPVYSPEESMKRFDVAEGFRVELVAAEPLVQDPISICFDERGRLWMLEWPTYNMQLRGVFPGLEKIDTPKSRVVVLEDTDGDGKMDKRTVFLEDFDFPRGLQVMKDGALVLKLPELVFAHDANGDGKADRQDVLVKDIEVPVNPHGAQSNLLRAMDNWIYGSRFTQRMRESRGSWRSEPSLSLRGQWGFSQDNYGRFYYSSNGDHLRGDLVPEHYYTRNPNYSGTAGIDVRYPADQTTWPHATTAGINRRGQLRDENGTLQSFTSNTSPTVYRGNQFPPEYVGNVFLGDVAGRLIRRSVLTEKDGMITAQNAYEKREFLFSRDERFRPVYTANGPDGALYIADMYRGLIEGHLFITSYLRNQVIERGLQHPFGGMGRIYRIVHAANPRLPAVKIDRNDAAPWIALLAHPNGFWRDTAQRLLVEKGDRRVAEAVGKMARESPDELARLHALWTLEGLDAVTPSVVASALADNSFRIRMAGLRLAEPALKDQTIAGKVLALTKDPRVEVRRQLLFSLGEGKGAAFEQAMAEVLARDGAQPIFVDAAMSGLHGREFAFLVMLLKDPSWRQERPAAKQLLSALGHAIVNAGKDDLGRLLTELADGANHPLWVRVAVLDGMVEARKRGMERVPDALGVVAKSSRPEVQKRAAALRKSWTTPMPIASAPMGRRSRGTPGFNRGEGLFAICSACHGPEGKGQPSIAPPLAESAIVAGPAEEVIRSVLFGRNQDRKNTAFPDMPPLGGLGDEDIAAVVTYVREKWGASTAPVTGTDVKKIRDQGSIAASAKR